MKAYSIHRDALAEARAGARWYRERSEQVAVAFIEEVEDAILAIRRTPEGGPRWRDHPAVRARVLRRFPYSIVYRLTTRGVRVLAIAHASRLPGYWRARR